MFLGSDIDADSSNSSGLLWTDVQRLSETTSEGEDLFGDDGGDLLHPEGDGVIDEDSWWAGILADVRNSRPHEYIIHETYSCSTEIEAKRMVTQILQSRRSKFVPTKYRNRGFITAGFHPAGPLSHLHVVHDCRWAQSACRCSWSKSFRRMVGFRRKARRLRHLQDQDLRAIAQYVVAQPRIGLLIEIQGEPREILREARGIRLEPGQGQSGDGLVEVCGMQGLCHGGRQGTGDGGGESTAQPPKTTARDAGRRRGGGRQASIVGLMEQCIISPPENVVHIDRYINNDELVYFRHNTPFISNTINRYKRKINELTVEELFQFHQNKDHYYESLTIKSMLEYYLDIDESIKAIVRLLIHQFSNVITMRNFLKTLYHFINKSLDDNKVNTIHVCGPPNSGKNFFFDSLCCFCINYGKIENPCRSNSFPFMNGVNRRINKWNEAKIDPAFFENVLDLMQGNVIYANVKYEAYTPITKTPLIVLSNHNVFPAEDRFNCRHIRYEWVQAPLLLDYNKKPFPLAIGSLILWAMGSDLVNVNYISNVIQGVVE